jgi:hypothetical protein
VISSVTLILILLLNQDIGQAIGAFTGIALGAYEARKGQKRLREAQEPADTVKSDDGANIGPLGF